MVYHSSVDSVDCGDCSGSADGVLWGLVMAVVVVLLVTEVVWGCGRGGGGRASVGGENRGFVYSSDHGGDNNHGSVSGVGCGVASGHGVEFEVLWVVVTVMIVMVELWVPCV